MLDVATLVARVIADTSGFEAGMGRAESKLAATSASFRSTGRLMTMGLTLPILAVAAESVKFAVGFQQQMEMIHTQAGASQQSVDQLTKSVLQLAPATRYGPEELAKALYHIESVSSGAITGAQAMNVLKVAAEGAAVGNANLEDTTSALMGTMRVFHEPASAATKVMGELNAIVGAGNMRMQDLNNAIATGIMPTARALHLSLIDVGAGLALMTDESTHANVAATRMRTAMLMATGETEKSRKGLASIGIGALDLAHAMQKPDGLVIAMADLNKHLEKIPDNAKRAQIVAQIFGGARSSGTILQFLNNLDMMKQKFDQINRTASNFPQDVIANQATDAYKLHQAWAGVQTVMTQLGGILAGPLVEAAQTVSKLASAVGKLSPAMQQVVVFGGLAVAALGPMLYIVGALMTPMGLVVASVIALAAAGVYLYQHFKAVRDVLDNVLDSIHGFTDAIGLTTPVVNRGTVGFGGMSRELTRFHQISDALHSAWAAIAPDLASAFAVVSHAADVVAQFVVAQFNQMMIWVHAHSATLKAGIEAAWHDIEAVTRAVWPIIKQTIQVVWDAIKIIVTTAIHVVENVILAVMEILQGHWSAAWHDILHAVGAILSGLGQLVWLAITKVIPLALRAAELVSEAMWKGIKKIGEFLMALPGVLLAGISSAISKAASAAGKEAVHIGEEMVKGILGGVSGLPSELGHKLTGYIHSAIGFAGGLLSGSGPFHFTIHTVGEPMAEGIIQGLERGLTGKLSKSARTKIEEEIAAVAANAHEIQAATNVLGRAATQGIIDGIVGKQESLTQQLKTSLVQAVQQATAAAKQAAQTAMDSLMSTFQTAASSILSAFEQQTSLYVAPAQKQLDAEQLQDQIKQMQDAVNQAQSQWDADKGKMQEALAGGDPEKIKAAQDQLLQDENAYYAAWHAQQEFNLGQTAKAQTDHYNKMRKKQEEHLAAQLAKLQKELAKHPEEYKKMNEKILRLMHQYDIPMYQAGQKFIDMFAGGMTKEIPAVEKAAKAAAAAAAKYLKLSSPAEAGPLSTLDHWWDAFAPTLLSGFDPSAIAKAAAGATSLPQVLPGANTQVGGSLTERGSDAPLVYVAEQHNYNDVDPVLAAAVIARKVAFSG